MTKIFLIDPRGKFNFSDSDVVSRHLFYLTKLEFEYGITTSLIVLGTTESRNLSNLEGIRVTDRTRNFIKFAFTARKNMLNEKSGLIVASDPWFSFATALLLKLIRGKSDRIQLQLHGQYLSNKESHPLNSLIAFYLRVCIVLSSSTRFVNVNEMEKIVGKRPMLRSKVFLAPVPINSVFFKTERHESDRPLTLGLVGRLHKERGLDTFIQLALKIQEHIPDLKLIIIGDGKSKTSFRNEVEMKFGSNFWMYESMPPDQLVDKLSEIGVLASCAPRESYGRAMREAIIRGVPVMAVRSDGAQYLFDQFGPDCVSIVDVDVETSLFLSEEFNRLVNVVVPTTQIEVLRRQDAEGTSKLAKSWSFLLR